MEKSSLARLDMQTKQMASRHADIAPEFERLGVQRARLRWRNVELDQRGGKLSEFRAAAASAVEQFAAQEAEGRAALAAIDEALKILRVEAQSAQEKRSRD